MANSVKVRVTGTGEVQKRLNALSLKGQSKAQVTIGFAAPYAVNVHENLTAYHPNGQAKFLETAYRRSARAARDVITQKLKQRRGLLDAMTAGGKVILNDARSIVPVDTGYLRDSGYVRAS